MNWRAYGGAALLAALLALGLAWGGQRVAQAQGDAGLLAVLQGGDIWLVRAEGGERRQLTRGGVIEWFAWAPQGDALVVSTRGPDGSPGGVFVQALDGSPPRRIDAAARQAVAGRRASWAPDGSQLAFVDDDAVMVVNREGTAARRYTIRLAAGPSGDLSVGGVALGTPTYYADGGRLLVPIATRLEIGAGGNARIRYYTLALDDGALTPVAAELPAMGGRLPQDTSFAPGSPAFGYTSVAYVEACEQYGFFARLDPEAPSLNVVDPLVASGPTIRVANRPQAVGVRGWGLYPRGYSWAPDGQRVALAFAYRDCGQGAQAPAPAYLYLASFSGEALALGRGRAPAWAPRGELLAYIAEESSTVRVRDLANNTEIDLGPGELVAWRPAGPR
jgi:hypothetical protein